MMRAVKDFFLLFQYSLCGRLLPSSLLLLGPRLDFFLRRTVLRISFSYFTPLARPLLPPKTRHDSFFHPSGLLIPPEHFFLGFAHVRDANVLSLFLRCVT